MPLPERQSLMKNALFLAGLYLDEIKLLHDLTVKMKTAESEPFDTPSREM